jgi:BMFP domain-containing protein YqiC
MMRIARNLLCLLFVFSGLFVQAQTPASATSASAPTTGSTSMTSIFPDLDRLEAAASQANHDLAYMRIEKWKADSDSKRQAQSTADSVQRNLTSALPALISNVRSAPQDLAEEFKLYRNLNALYDVFASLTESTGAFGAKSDYDALAQQLDVIDSVRRDLGNALENLTASTQSELAQLRTQVHTLQQAAATPPLPPKKVVVDDNEPAKKTTHKKKVTKPATPTDSSNTTSSGSSSNNGTATPAATPKSQ